MYRYLSLLIVLTSMAYGTPAEVSICFTPNKACQQEIIKDIYATKTSILVQAYSFTDKDIIAALISQHESGVTVRVLLDKSNLTSPYGGMKAIQNAGIPLKIDWVSGISHSKLLVLDGKEVITGSYNFSKAAYTVNVENVVSLKSDELSEVYRVNFEKRWAGAREAK